MFRKVLIANRGEIACRIIRTARRMGIGTVAVYSDADRDALHVSMADEAVHIGAAAPRESYLSIDRILDACARTGAEAVHPGYGFLSENAAFSEACKANEIVFVGPGENAIRVMGSKSAAKSVMEDAGVPLLPGFHGDNATAERLREAAAQMGYPVLLKAVAGGGGKGMRAVWQPEDFDAALESAKREAAASFGNDDMLVERLLQQPRHVEIQVFCDRNGHAVYLFERDCSVQRRHQKVIEEAPAPGMTEELRRSMGEAAVTAARAIGYEGAGTVEFLLDRDGSFYFMEMNTRLQVEHPVTEMITGQDLVEWQIRVAAGQDLPLRQEQLKIIGHSLEARIYAEDPENEFLPSTGVLRFLQPPGENRHVRVDTGVLQGDRVSVFYDPMIAKLVVWDEDRPRALMRLSRALSEYRVSGLSTNITFLYNLVNHPAFASAELDTGFIETHRDALFHTTEADLERDLPLASLYLLLRLEQRTRGRAAPSDPHSPWNAGNAWRLNLPGLHTGAIVMAGKRYEVPAEEIGAGQARRFRISFGNQSVIASGELDGDRLTADIDGHRRNVVVAPQDNEFTLFTEEGALKFSLDRPDLGESEDRLAPGAFAAPMNGVIVKQLVEPGAAVEKGQAVLIMEAMKMEHTLRAPVAGTVDEFYCQPGDQVEGQADLLHFTASDHH